MIRSIKSLLITFLLFCSPALAASNPANIPAVQTISQMMSLGAASAQYQTIQVLGYNTPGDGGGGLFVWQSSSTTTADSCVNFQATGVSVGRWVRQLNGNLSVLMCGAYNNNTNPSSTKTAFQSAVNYMQRTGSPNPNSIISIPAGTYNCGTSGTFCVQTNGANWCPRFVGDGPGATDVRFQASSGEASVFLFNSSIGECNGGGVENMRVTGNQFTNACFFQSVNNVHCNVQVNGAATVAIFCSCTNGGFVENSTIQILTGSTVTNRYAEFRTNSGGTGSFRHSGIAPESYVSMSQSTWDEIILIDNGSQLYSCPLNLSVNYQPGSVGGTKYLINNQSANTPSCYGSIQLEVDAVTNPSIFKLVRAGAVFCSCSLQPQITGTGQLVYGNMLWAGQAGNIGGLNSFKSSYVVLENAASAVQYLTAGTGATTTVNINVSSSTNIYNLSIFNGSTYNWAGQVLVEQSGVGGCTASLIAGNKFFGTGNPTFGCSGGALTITVPDTIAANSTRIFGVVNIAGESN